MKFRVAFPMESGEMDVVDTFEADTRDEAEKYAEEFTAENYPDRVDDWYVLRPNGKALDEID
jgi:hypothetical protein